MAENKLLKEIPEDLMAMIKKLIALNKHQEKNKQDKTAKRGLQLTNSSIRRLIKYYKKTGKLDQNWKFEVEKVKMYAE